MRRLGWIGGVVGGLAAYRWVRRRPQVAAEPMPKPADDPADELRAKLAESRTAETAAVEESRPEVEESPPEVEESPLEVEESPPESPPEPVLEEEPAIEPDSPEDRRRRVHEEGRAALDEMKPDGTDG